MIVTAFIIAYSLVAVLVLDQNRGPILPCASSELTYEEYCEEWDLIPTPSQKQLFESYEQPLNRFCQLSQAMQAWIALICL